MTPFKIDFDESPEAIKRARICKRMWNAGLILFCSFLVIQKALVYAVDNYEKQITGYKFTLFEACLHLMTFCKYTGGFLVIAVLYTVITAIINSAIGDKNQ